MFSIILLLWLFSEFMLTFISFITNTSRRRTHLHMTYIRIPMWIQLWFTQNLMHTVSTQWHTGVLFTIACIKMILGALLQVLLLFTFVFVRVVEWTQFYSFFGVKSSIVVTKIDLRNWDLRKIVSFLTERLPWWKSLKVITFIWVYVFNVDCL